MRWESISWRNLRKNISAIYPNRNYVNWRKRLSVPSMDVDVCLSDVFFQLELQHYIWFSGYYDVFSRNFSEMVLNHQAISKWTQDQLPHNQFDKVATCGIHLLSIGMSARWTKQPSIPVLYWDIHSGWWILFNHGTMCVPNWLLEWQQTKEEEIKHIIPL